jgi:hypothetical protein
MEEQRGERKGKRGVGRMGKKEYTFGVSREGREGRWRIGGGKEK